MKILFWLFELLLSMSSSFKNALSGIAEKKIARIYLSGINILKAAFINLFILSLSLFLVLAGLILLPVSVVIFSSWDNSTKILVGIIIAVIYIAAGFLISLWMFEETRWNRRFLHKEK